MKLTQIKTKKAWRRIVPNAASIMLRSAEAESNTINDSQPASVMVWQSDFLREYYPSGHHINDPMYYPDIYRQEEVEELDKDGNPIGVKMRTYVERVPRYAFAFQRVITVKQLMHLCGNDIQFDLIKSKPTQKETDDMEEFREGWLEKDMEVAFFETKKSTKITGDGAFVAFFSEGKFGWKVLSFKDGSTLYPHYDPITGKMTLFARSYVDYDENNNPVEWLEVWDERMFTRYRKAESTNKVKLTIQRIFGLDGYEMVYSAPHGYTRVPVAYDRDDEGACWSFGQDSIDGYELSYSQMAHNNEAFGEPILYLQGDNVEAVSGLNGTIKMLTMGKDDNAGYLQSQSASESYQRQLDINYKMIYEQTFTVIPPELKSGDLPAAALKILYSPAYEKAFNDAQECQGFLNDMKELFAYGYGLEKGKTIAYQSLPIKAWVKPYVHVNASAEVADLAASVQNGFLSKQTASERASYYSMPDEWERIMREQKEQQQADLLTQLRAKKAQQTQTTSTEGDE